MRPFVIIVRECNVRKTFSRHSLHYIWRLFHKIHLQDNRAASQLHKISCLAGVVSKILFQIGLRLTCTCTHPDSSRERVIPNVGTEEIKITYFFGFFKKRVNWWVKVNYNMVLELDIISDRFRWIITQQNLTKGIYLYSTSIYRHKYFL